MSPVDPSPGWVGRVILLDIEGTTTPVEFVTKVLFPFARRRASDFIRRHCDDGDVLADIESLKREHDEDRNRDLRPPSWEDRSAGAEPASVHSYMVWLMNRDRKSTALKTLQGRIWEEGYLTGELRGEVYADVPPALKRWRAQGKEICIFSSGSVLAQRLLFAHTNQGDLSGFIREYFDTAVGAKKAPSSYARIAAALGVVPDGILFISDVVAELDAASSAGMQTLLCARAGPAEATPPACDHLVITTFDEVFP